MNKCPECGSELISEIKNSTLIVRCSKCNFSVVTTHIDPIYNDRQEYEVVLTKGNTITRENFFLIQAITGMNMKEIRCLFETAPYSLFKGYAPDVKELKEKMDDCNMKYEIIPKFKY